MPEPAEMNGADIGKMPGSGVPGSEGKDPVANGHAENESNPFAEYMWMENEEEYNRQGKSILNPEAKEFVPGVKY
ncbi:hypothetical protein cypCar_00002767 [Cyprinus carpio]|nr:hypothetical protein cypCar_00002767 [Cyprinus carpio]